MNNKIYIVKVKTSSEWIGKSDMVEDYTCCAQASVFVYDLLSDYGGYFHAKYVTVLAEFKECDTK